MDNKNEIERKELYEEESEKVSGGGHWYDAPENPKCPRCGSKDTKTRGIFGFYKAECRSCGRKWRTSCTKP